jgi:hypothetical protein
MGAVDIFVAYKFIKILATPWKRTDAYKLGIIDKNGKVLKKKKDLESNEEKKAYTIFHRLIWNVKRLLDHLPGGKTKIGSFAAALWMLKEYAESRGAIDSEHLVTESFTDYLIQNNYMTKYEIDNQLSNYIFEQDLLNEKDSNILKKGKYKLINDVDSPKFKARKGDIIVVPKDIKAFGTLLGVNLFKVTDRNAKKELVVSHEDLEQI